MYKLTKSKKGIAIDDLLPLVFTIIIFFFIALLIFAGDGKKKNEMSVEVAGKFNEIKDQKNLLTFLEKEVIVSQKTATVSDLIMLATIDGDYSKLEELNKEYLDPIYYISGGNSWRAWELKIETMPKEKELLEQIGSQGTNKGGLSTILLTKAILPLPSKDDYLKISLFKRGRGSAMEP